MKPVATKQKKSEMLGKGCVIQGFGLIAPFTLYALIGPAGIWIGLLFFVLLFFVGSSQSRYWICSQCGTRLPGKAVTECPGCHVRFDADTPPVPVSSLSPEAESPPLQETTSPPPTETPSAPPITFHSREQRAQRHLLSHYLKPRPLNDSSLSSQDWGAALGDDRNAVLQQFRSDNLLVPASTDNRLSKQYKVPDLKALLKQRGLPVSGRKADLIDRLMQADPEGMDVLVSQMDLVVCSPTGRELVEQYQAQVEAERTAIAQELSALLLDRKYQRACKRMGAYEAQQVFPRSNIVDWRSYASDNSRKTLKYILTGKPGILQSLPASQLDALRIPTALSYLFGEFWSSAPHFMPDMALNSRFDCETACRMLWMYARNQATLQYYRSMKHGSQEVEIIGNGNSCSACQHCLGVVYHINDVPELPNPQCTSNNGCRCTYVSAISYDEHDY